LFFPPCVDCAGYPSVSGSDSHLPGRPLPGYPTHVTTTPVSSALFAIFLLRLDGSTFFLWMMSFLTGSGPLFSASPSALFYHHLPGSARPIPSRSGFLPQTAERPALFTPVDSCKLTALIFILVRVFRCEDRLPPSVSPPP